ncbi:MAG: hypothetical protein KR126chlam4_00177 [Candidatus Anoxychlamydiales bacterium]|nr:hypothetical protein [Candidatus Anoxychlamydiales bacterium]NGX40358.1 hypothetical protein [Candidatus Anoxychlamydiales bacterium]HEU64473.1 hypothetical protein [Chlamydiota bacterium]
MSTKISGRDPSKKIEVLPGLFEKLKEEEMSRKERVQAAIDNSVPGIQNGVKSSTDGSITLSGVAVKAALNAYAPEGKCVTDSVVNASVTMALDEKKESFDPHVNSTIRKTADYSISSIGKSC